MRVTKWGDSVAVRLPATIVETLGLQEGDEIEVTVAGTRRFEIERDDSHAKALARLKAPRRPLPKGFRFDRDEARNEPTRDSLPSQRSEQ